ncbi:NitT/TauT family transport system permease protein [Acidocella aminolytica 101 = DSM 11237]|nr:NitT/TauT family transport system permease protein [Acidocella aminolytica 101 = DSM 11237]
MAQPGRKTSPRLLALRRPLPSWVAHGIAIATCLALLILWEITVDLGWTNPIFLPAPSTIIATMWDMSVNGNLLPNTGVSIARVAVAFALSAIMAVPIGIAMSVYRPIGAGLEPVIDFIRYLPVPALVPLSIIWFGIGEETKIFLLWLGTFFQLVLMVAQDTDRVPHEYFEIASTLGAKPLEILRLVAIRAMLPSLVDNLRITLGWCWTYLIIAEIVASNSGLGFVIWTARRFMETSQVMAGVVMIGIIGLVTDQLLRRLHKKMFGYMHS